MSKKTIVIALGGNALIRTGEKGTFEQQEANLLQTSEQLIDLVTQNRVVITHGNGPQVGNLVLASEAAAEIVPPMPFDICGAATQGFMGYMIQKSMANILRRKGLKHNITTVVTQVIVDKKDTAFKNPSKPIGPFYNAEQMEKLRKERGWDMIEDSKRGYRRIVPSPMPIDIQQARIVQAMLDADEIVVAVGGGGIPVVRNDDGSLEGCAAVIDKDLASSRLGIEIDAELLLILTAVEKVSRDFNKPTQKEIDHLTVKEAEALLAAGQFGKGSMEPKIRAAIMFLKESKSKKKKEVIITLPEKAAAAIAGKTGTRITL